MRRSRTPAHGIFLLLLVATATMTGGCRHQVERLEAQAAPEMIHLDPPPDEPPPPHVLGAGDLLGIQVNDLPETAQRCRVGIDGMVRFGPCGDVPAAGHSISDLNIALTTQLQRFYRDPIVEIQLMATVSRRVIALGQIGRPGAINLTGGERILDLLSRCGGLARSGDSRNEESLADLASAIYVRGDRLLHIDFEKLIATGDQRQNISVHPGDFFYIPSSIDRQVFVLGAVNQPNVVTMQSSLSVSRAVAAAGGPTRDAYIDRTILIRGSRTNPVAARIDLHGILEGRKPDLPLMKGDIIYLPGRTSENPRFWVDQFNESFLTTVTSRYANEIYDRTRGR